ncbi:hypothetical protein FOPE_12446 [Fonsecaea pedrosoi]|nr:hypothetical protein FOPE_12446 [Fonsecaea pedrosoi]
MADLPLRTRMAVTLLRSNPSAWFRDAPIEPRDLELISADRVDFVVYNQGSYLRKIYHIKAGEGFESTIWKVEADEECKELVRSAGAKLYGYDEGPSISPHWAIVTVSPSNGVFFPHSPRISASSRGLRILVTYTFATL